MRAVQLSCWLVFALVPGLASCVKDVIMDAKERPQVSVVCILSDDPVQELRLLFTKGASRQEVPPLLEAEAVLTDLSVPEEAGRFSRSEDGVWRLDYAAKPGHRYRLDVTVPGYDPLWAEDTMPGKLRFYLQSWYWLCDKLESPTGYWIDFFWGTDEIPDISTGLTWNDGENLPLGETYFCVAELKDPVWIYAMNYNPVTGQREIAEEICTEYAGVDDCNLNGETYSPPQWEEGIPFPVKPEYAALLADTHTKALYPWLEGSPMHRRYLRLFPREIGMDPFKPLGFGVSGSFSGRYNCDHSFYRWYYPSSSRAYGHVRNLAGNEGYVVCMAVSEQYDRYLKEVYRTQELQASTDLSAIFLRDNMYTNIKASKGYPALGFFGCKVERKFQWSGEGTYVDYDRSAEAGSFDEKCWWSFAIPESELQEMGILL